MSEIELKLEAMKFLKEWSTWVAAINTAAIFGIASIFGEGTAKQDRLLVASVACFVLSVAGAAWLLGEMPSIIQRLGSAPDWIYSAHTFQGHGPPLWFFAGTEHLFFLLGLVFFAGALFRKLW